LSFLSLGLVSFETFFTQRIGEEREEPSLRFFWPIGVLALLDASASIIFITLLLIFCGGYVILVVPVLIGINFVIQRFFDYSRALYLEYGVEEPRHSVYIFDEIPITASSIKMRISASASRIACKIRTLFHLLDPLDTCDHRNKNLKKEIAEKLRISAFTSWMTSTVVVKSTINVQLVSSFVATFLYTLLHLISITYIILTESHETLEDFSIIICMPKNFKTEAFSQREILFGSSIGFNIRRNKFALRQCWESEEPIDVLLYLIVPILILCTLSKLFSGFTLSKLSKYQCLLSMPFQESIYFLDAIKNPLDFQGELLDWLSKNPEILNKQNCLTGQTILHRLRPIKMNELLKGVEGKEPFDEFLKLYIKGGQHDILDTNSRSAISHWAKFHLPQLPNFKAENQSASKSKILVPKYIRKLLLCGIQLSSVDWSGHSLLKDIMNQLEHLNEENQDAILNLCKAYCPSDVVKMLHLACKEGNKNLVNILVRCEISFQHRDQFGCTALHVACLVGSADFVELLLNKGASHSAKTEYGWTSLHLASQYGFLECVKLLISKEAEIDAKTNSDKTPFHLACQRGHLECVKLLINEGADKDAKDIDDCTSLHFACQNGHLSCVKFLIELNADTEVRSKKGLTCLDVAFMHKQMECVELLKNKNTEVEYIFE